MIKAVIAVRSGSERVKNKNVKPFANSSLLEIKIKQLLRLSSYFDGIIVNSNDETMLSTANSLGCETVLRDSVYADSRTSMSDVYANVAENCAADVIVYCNVTNPLVKDETIIKAVELYCEQSNSCSLSVNTANLVKKFMYRDGVPINYNPLNQPRSQDLPEIYALNFAVNIISRREMIKYKNIICPRHLLLPISESEAVDIDSEMDFEVAQFLYLKRRKVCCDNN